MPVTRSRSATPAGALALLLVFCTGAGLGCSPPLPDLVLVTLDTTRADHLGHYGYFRDTSPHLDGLASESLVFDQHVVPMATTLPTHTSILTGTYPSEHGILANVKHAGERFVPSPGLTSFAQYSASIGYRTAAFVSATPLKSGTGIEQGFASFDEPEASERRAGETTDRALAWLGAADPEAPFFLWVHYFDPHGPFSPPAPYDTMFQTDAALESLAVVRRLPEEADRARGGRSLDPLAAINLYDGEIRYMDAEIGRLLGALRARPGWARTVVVVAGDHGESLGQHGEMGHGRVWGEQLRAPLMMRLPGEPAQRIEAVTSSVDIWPTALAFLDLPGKDRWLTQTSGRNAADSGAVPRPAFSRTSLRQDRLGYTPLSALTTERWKYLRADAGVESLFDRRDDPHELQSVDARRPEVTQKLREELSALVATHRARALELQAGRTAPVDEKTRRELEQLGYAGDEEGSRSPGD